MIGPDIYGFRGLWRQYRACRRNTRNTVNALRFELDAEANLLAVQRELRDHTYHPGRSICFITDGPKPREVFAAEFRDRVVHHLLVSRVEPIFERRFIHDSYACRRGKGTLAASDRLMQFLRRVTVNGRRAAWALKLDVADFFPSIHKATLYALLERRVRNPEILWLTRTFLFHDPTTNYQFRSRGDKTPGPASGRYPVPPNKSLFGKRNQRGLPIGNLTSQFWANVYLNELDQFVKRTLRCRLYVRYVDDVMLLSNDPGELTAWRSAIASFLAERLHLRLRPDGIEPIPVKCGVDFVGWKTWWHHRVTRRRTLSNLDQRCSRFTRASVRPMLGGRAQRVALDRVDRDGSVEHLRSSIASYSGHLRHGATRKAWETLWSRHSLLEVLFVRQGWNVKLRFPSGHRLPASTFRRQYWALTQRAGDRCLVFCPVGRFIEFRGPQRLLATAVLHLRSAYLPRAGFALVSGFPARARREYALRALAANHAVAFIVERPGGPAGRCKVRVPKAILMSRSWGQVLAWDLVSPSRAL